MSASAEIVAGDYDAHSVSLWTRKSWDGVRDLIARAPAIIIDSSMAMRPVRQGFAEAKLASGSRCLTTVEPSVHPALEGGVPLA